MSNRENLLSEFEKIYSPVSNRIANRDLVMFIICRLRDDIRLLKTASDEFVRDNIEIFNDSLEKYRMFAETGEYKGRVNIAHSLLNN